MGPLALRLCTWKKKRRKGHCEVENEIFLLLFRHLAAIERKKRFGLVKIELVAEWIHTESVAKALGTNPSRAYEWESDSRLFPGKRNSSDRKAQLSLSRDLSLLHLVDVLLSLCLRHGIYLPTFVQAHYAFSCFRKVSHSCFFFLAFGFGVASGAGVCKDKYGSVLSVFCWEWSADSHSLMRH